MFLDHERGISVLRSSDASPKLKGDLSWLKMIANDNDSFGKFISRLLLQRFVYYRCFVGKNKIAVTATGECFHATAFAEIWIFVWIH